MNPHQLKRLFPHASKSVLAANSGDYGTGKPEAEANPTLPNPQPQPHQAAALERAAAGKEESVERITVRFTLYRCRLLDPDNAAGSVKDVLDGLRHCQLIPGDEWHRIRLEVDQEKVGSLSKERTELVIIWP